MNQPHLIDSILKELHLDQENAKSKSTPAAASKLLSAHTSSEAFDGHFNYRRVIGKLNYLEKSTRPDIAYAVHQCARFVSDPKVEHGNAVKWLGRYLQGTKDKGIILSPQGKSFDVYVDADFAGNWNKEEAEDDGSTARSRYGYFIRYMGCPILWASKLQTEIALSSTESEFIGLSHALRTTIPLMELVKELKAHGYKMGSTKPKVHCEVFEDNSGAIEIAQVPKMRPRTKHINIKYYHFRDYVERGEISIHKIATEEQPSDILTKPVNATLLNKHRGFIMGWFGKSKS
jgi:ATP-binding cassette subfamily B (MDR/TAP) protein 1